LAWHTDLMHLSCHNDVKNAPKAQSLKPQGLSTSLGKNKTSFNEAYFRHAFWCILKKHEAHLGVLFYFIAKKDTNH